MKFKPEHTVDFMIARANEEADGYFELTLTSPGKATLQERLSVTVTRAMNVHPWANGTRVVWRRGTAVITREAARLQLMRWKEKQG